MTLSPLRWLLHLAFDAKQERIEDEVMSKVNVVAIAQATFPVNCPASSIVSLPTRDRT
jgi:hypothetical protein